MFRTISGALLATAVSVFALNAYAGDVTDTSSQTTATTTTTAPANTGTNSTTKMAPKHKRHVVKKHKVERKTVDPQSTTAQPNAQTSTTTTTTDSSN
jgi:hypothetical protein